MIIGVDFDNTIVSYDALFHRVCSERGLIPPELPVSKSEVRDHLRRARREDDWTEVQGYVYGARMGEAQPYPGVLEFFRECRRRGVETYIISHKTRRPYRGEPYDLHSAAWDWLDAQGFFELNGIALPRNHVHLEPTKSAKLMRIGAVECSWFVDDLPEFLALPEFPSSVERLLFDPNELHTGHFRFPRASSWPAVREIVLGCTG